MSTHEAKVVKIQNIEPHPNADALEIVNVWGYQCCIKKGSFAPNDLAVFVEPDTLVPVDNPAFAFLRGKENAEGYAKIRAVKLRGNVSYGLLVPAPLHLKENDNAFDHFKLKHYEPDMVTNFGRGLEEKAPNIPHVKYDMENYKKYTNLLIPGEEVIITEKLNGCNSIFTFSDNALHCSSHYHWKREGYNDIWWTMANKLGLKERLSKYPDYLFYGEIYGQTKPYYYGLKEPAFAVFDIMHNGSFIDWPELIKITNDLNLPTVPIITQEPWDPSLVKHCQGMSTIPNANHIREGVVVKPIKERRTHHGRIILKVINPEYLMK